MRAPALNSRSPQANHFRFPEIVSSPKIKNISQQFALPEPQITGTTHPVPPGKRGARDRNERGTGCGGRGVRKAIAHEAYGKSVWSRRRSAGVNAPGCLTFQGATEAKELFSGESSP